MQNQLFKDDHTKNYAKLFINQFLKFLWLKFWLFLIYKLSHTMIFFSIFWCHVIGLRLKSSIKRFSQIWFQMNYENNENLSIHFYIVGYLLQNWYKNLAIFLIFVFSNFSNKEPQNSVFWTFFNGKILPIRKRIPR